MRNVPPFVILITMLLLSLTGNAQEKKIAKKDLPPAVLKAFTGAYPQATIKGLSSEQENGKTYYEIESIEGKTHRDLLYTPDGSLAEIEEGVSLSDLPDPVKATVKREFPSGRISLAEKTTKGTAVSYELRVSTEKKRMTVTVAPDGKLLSREPAGGKNEEKND